MNRSDESLLEQIAAGSQAAFAAFYDSHAPRILGLLVRILRRRADADDALQETFWNVWKRAKDYDSARSSPLAWLAMIARSRALDQMRRRAAADRMERGETGVSPLDPAGAAEAQERTELAVGALSRLPLEQQHVLRLAFYNGLTHDQIASRESLPLGTVKTRIRLGMRRLQDLLNPSQRASAI